jgi:hypothetical protein
MWTFTGVNRESQLHRCRDVHNIYFHVTARRIGRSNATNVTCLGSGGSCRRAALPASSLTSPSPSPGACDSQRARPHATVSRVFNLNRTPSLTSTISNHGLRKTLPLPQAAMDEQRQHAHSRRLPSRRSRTHQNPSPPPDHHTCNTTTTNSKSRHSSPSPSSS